MINPGKKKGNNYMSQRLKLYETKNPEIYVGYFLDAGHTSA
jgi:hypothetical protein